MTPQRRSKKANRAAKKPAESAESQLRSFVAKFTPEHQSLIRATRRWLRNRLPTAHELVYDNYNAIRKLIDEAVSRTRSPFTSGAKGSLVIRSISAKQRPRRRTA